MPDFMTECDLYLNQKMSHFAKIAGFKKLDKKWFCKYFGGKKLFQWITNLM